MQVLISRGIFWFQHVVTSTPSRLLIFHLNFGYSACRVSASTPSFRIIRCVRLLLRKAFIIQHHLESLYCSGMFFVCVARTFYHTHSTLETKWIRIDIKIYWKINVRWINKMGRKLGVGLLTHNSNYNDLIDAKLHWVRIAKPWVMHCWYACAWAHCAYAWDQLPASRSQKATFHCSSSANHSRGI